MEEHPPQNQSEHAPVEHWQCRCGICPAYPCPRYKPFTHNSHCMGLAQVYAIHAAFTNASEGNSPTMSSCDLVTCGPRLE
eukprot:3127290-Amphidinium_carterae.1